MELKLTVIRYNNNIPQRPLSYTWGEINGTIGRKPDNDWVLPDVQRHLSGHHATIEFRDGEYHILDMSQSGVFINGALSPLGHGNSYRLKAGDVIRMDEYEISVSLGSLSGGNNAGLPDGPAISAPSFPGEALGEKHASVWTDDPFNHLISGIDGDDQGSKYAGLVPANVANRVISLPKTPNNADVHRKDSLPPRVSPFPDESKQKGPFIRPENAEMASVRNKESALYSDADAVADFLEGAGLAGNPAYANLAQTIDMKALGNLFQIVTKGTMDVLRTRAEIKEAMRMDVTVIQRINNNPLKLPIPVEEAMANLLSSEEQGYLPVEQAFQEAYDDISVHQVAVIAGVQSALKHVLQRFDPEPLVGRLERDSPIEAIIPVLRQAKLWELFEDLYDVLEEECQDAFQDFFGEAFVRAYELQSANIRQEKLPNNAPMELVLTIKKLKSIPVSQIISHTWTKKGGTIGRLENNDWVLLDTMKRISRQHAIIGAENNKFFIKDTSLHGVFINRSDEKVGRGNSYFLQEGDVIRIGAYEMLASLHQQGMEDSTEPEVRGGEHVINFDDAPVLPIPERHVIDLDDAPASLIPDKENLIEPDWPFGQPGAIPAQDELNSENKSKENPDEPGVDPFASLREEQDIPAMPSEFSAPENKNPKEKPERVLEKNPVFDNDPFAFFSEENDISSKKSLGSKLQEKNTKNE